METGPDTPEALEVIAEMASDPDVPLVADEDTEPVTPSARAAMDDLTRQLVKERRGQWPERAIGPNVPTDV